MKVISSRTKFRLESYLKVASTHLSGAAAGAAILATVSNLSMLNPNSDSRIKENLISGERYHIIEGSLKDALIDHLKVSAVKALGDSDKITAVYEINKLCNQTDNGENLLPGAHISIAKIENNSDSAVLTTSSNDNLRYSFCDMVTSNNKLILSDEDLVMIVNGKEQKVERFAVGLRDD